MTSNVRRVALALATLPFLGGCITQSILEEPGDSKFGEANRQTMMAQIIDPEPVYEGPLVTSGNHAAQAVDRYNKDTVKQPDRVQTSSGSSSGPN